MLRSDLTAAPRVLVVDPDDLLRHTLTVRLRQHAFEVVETGDPFVARELLSSHDIDVVLLGGLELSGLALLEDVSRSRPSCRVILVNDAKHISLSIAAMRRGAFAEIVAPFDLADLVELIETASAAGRAGQRPSAGRVPPNVPSGAIVPPGEMLDITRRGTPLARSPGAPASGPEDGGEPRDRAAPEKDRAVAAPWAPRAARSD